MMTQAKPATPIDPALLERFRSTPIGADAALDRQRLDALQALLAEQSDEMQAVAEALAKPSPVVSGAGAPTEPGTAPPPAGPAMAASPIVPAPLLRPIAPAPVPSAARPADSPGPGKPSPWAQAAAPAEPAVGGPASTPAAGERVAAPSLPSRRLTTNPPPASTSPLGALPVGWASAQPPEPSASRPRHDDATPFRSVTSTAAAPSAEPAVAGATAAAPPSDGLVDVDTYAVFRALCDVYPDRIAATCERYGVSWPGGRAAVDQRWQARLAAEPTERQRWEELYAYYRDWYAAHAG